MVHLSGDHHFEPQRSGDSRCPCPALNAMANHGYLPRDGLHIGWWQLIRALHEVYNLSYPLAIILSTVGIIFCGSLSHPGTLHLHELGWHNRIEHNCSLAHADAAPGAKFAPNHSDRTLLCRLLSTSVTSMSTVLRANDFALARIRRALESKKTIDKIHSEIAHGEAGLTLLTMGVVSNESSYNDVWIWKLLGRWFAPSDDTRVVQRQFIRTWFGDDRFPDNWERPKKTITLFRAVYMSRVIEKEIAGIDHSLENAT